MNELEGEEGPRRRDRSQEDCVPAQRQKKGKMNVGGRYVLHTSLLSCNEQAM